VRKTNRLCHKKRGAYEGHNIPLIISLLVTAFWLATFAISGFAQAATITVVNLDGPGEGFNDPAPVAPVGGNTGLTVGQQRLIAFQFAADFWEARIDSPVEIRVGTNFDPLPCTATSGTLGQAGPETVHRDFIGAPVANTWYPQALANSLAGVDLAPGQDDVGATFNSNLGTPGCLSTSGWYYGLDASPPPGRFDFVSILAHELGHGLGFLTFVNLATGVKLSGSNDIFMLFLEDHSTGKLYPNMTDAERVTASKNTGNLHWVGPDVVAASGFLTNGRDPTTGHVQMYAPNPQQPGSSVSHFSNALFPDELMEPFYTGPNHDIELTLQLLADIGWNVLGESSVTFSGWLSLPGGGATLAGPAITIFNGTPQAFIRGMNNGIYQNGLTAGGWSAVPGGGLTLAGPAATVFNGTLYLFVRGTDNRIYQNLLTAGGWSGWSVVPGGGLTPAGPAATVFENFLYLTVQGIDNHIYDNLFTSVGWTGWAEVPGGGLTPSGPAATVFNGELWYVVRGMDNRLYRNVLPASATSNWTGWSEVLGGGLTLSEPGAAATASTLYLVVRGTDNGIYLNQGTIP
jgi:hypothetical protein